MERTRGRGGAPRAERVSPRTLVAAALAAALVLGGSSSAPPTTRAADPPSRQAAEFLARRDGGPADNYRLVYERDTILPGNGAPAWAGKLLNVATGRVTAIYRTADGSIGDSEMVRGLARAALARQGAVERKAGRALREALQRGLPGPSQRLPVALWLSVDTEAAARAVKASHPEVSWLGDRPVANDLAVIRQLRAEMWEARREAIQQAAQSLLAEVAQRGGRLGYLSSSAPIVFVDLPPSAVAPIAERADVEEMDLEGRWEPTLSAPGVAVEANWTSGGGDLGSGIRVGVVEYHNVRNSGDLAGKVVAAHSTTGKLAYAPGFDHPTWVAGAIAGQSSSYRGVAPGALIVSSGTGGYTPSLAYDRAVIAAADWAVSPGGGDADIVNTSLAQDTSTGAEEARRYFDSIVEEDGRLAISAAGNYVNFNNWLIGSPGTGYNVLTVGGVDDRGTAGRTDDRLWYVPGSNGSNWVDSPSASWNSHGDYNKPNLVAPSVAVRTANGLAASGTSVATPIVAGIAAQVLANEPVLAAWPEGMRAVLMAGAIHRVPMPDGSRNEDHEGVGMASALWSNRVAVAGDGELGGYVLGSLTDGEEPVQSVSVRAGDRLRVALAWNSHTSGSGNLDLTDTLRADLDLEVTDPAGHRIGSYTFDNAHEFVEVVMPSTGTATIRVRQTRFDGSSETYGLAWAKVRDTQGPSVTFKAPLPNEPWAVPSVPMAATFSEPVSGVSKSNVRLVNTGSGTSVGVSVAYQAGSRTAVVTPRAPLAPGRYRLVLRPGITDAAGNTLDRTAWSFTVRKPSRQVSSSYASARPILFSAGTHVGYRFDSAGNVTGSRAYSLSRRSGAKVDRRATIPGKPGVWLRVTNGVWAGYWVREGPGSGVAGRAAIQTWSNPKRVQVAAGTHVGVRFDSSGRVTATKSFRLSSASGAHVTARAVFNGAWHLKVSDGVWAGYWLPESSSAHVAGIFDLQDLHGVRAVMEKGRRTGYAYWSSGEVRSSRTVTLGSRSGAPVAAWAVINGQPTFYVTAGGWRGYWLPESSGVHLP